MYFVLGNLGGWKYLRDESNNQGCEVPEVPPIFWNLN